MNEELILSMLDRSFMPEEVCAGSGSIRRLSVLSGRRAFLLATPSSDSSGSLEKVRDALDKSGLDTAVQVRDCSSPTADLVDEVSQDVNDQNADVVLSLGGGSVIDAGKLSWAKFENPDLNIGGTEPSISSLGEKCEFVAIPTTFSGAEASVSAVLTQADGRKSPIVSDQWLPNLAILDSDTVASLSPDVVATTGFDALAHAIEAYVSRNSGLISRQRSIRAVELLLENLADVYKQEASPKTISKVQIASFFAGAAQSTASTGITHAISHSCSTVLDSSHSMATSFFLLPGMKFNERRGVESYSSLSSEIGMSTNETIDRIEELYQSFGLPSDLNELAQSSVTDTDCSEIAELASKDVCIRTNPVRADSDDIEKIISEKVT